MSSSLTPAAAGYRMPAEWEPHAATWLSWPRPEGISFPGRFETVPAIWSRLTALLAEDEEVHINVFSPEHRASVEGALRAASLTVGKGIHLHDFPAYEPWCRDHGPIFVRNPQGGMAVVDWGYNAWGGKYPPHDLDDEVPRHVAEYLGLPLYQPGIVMEGGSLDVNGAGTLLTTESCLLNPNRNPHLSKAEIEAYLRDYLGVSKILWLGDGIVGDDTDGHVDDLTRFVNAETVVTVVEDDPAGDDDDGGGNAAPGGRSTDAARPLLRGSAASRQLREFLHRQPQGTGAGLRRSQGRGGLRDPGRAFPRTPGGAVRCRRFDLGAGCLALHHAAAAARLMVLRSVAHAGGKLRFQGK